MATKGPRLGYWGSTPGDPDGIDGMRRWESRIGRAFNLYRSRGGEGSFNRPVEWLLPESLDALGLGRVVSLQIAPKTGTGGNRRGVSYDSIARGDHDDLIREGFEQIAADLPDGAPRQPFEVHSEANIQQGAVAAQPTSGPPDTYPAFAKRVDAIAREVGVRKRLIFMLTMTRGPWESDEWKAWTYGLDDIIDMYAADGYSMPRTASAKSLESVAKATITAARSKGKRWAVMETGCQEYPGNAGGKAQWYTDAASFLAREGSDCYAVVFNTSDDGPGGWPPSSSATSLNGFKKMATSGAFRPGSGLIFG